MAEPITLERATRELQELRAACRALDEAAYSEEQSPSYHPRLVTLSWDVVNRVRSALLWWSGVSSRRSRSGTQGDPGGGEVSDWETLREALLRDSDTGTPSEFFARMAALTRRQDTETRLREALERIRDSKGYVPTFDISEARVLARTALEPKETQ